MASLGMQAAAELIGTWWILAVGNSLIANEVLASTKGNKMGFGFIALYFGLAFFLPLICFSDVSATFNPASAIFKWVLGRISTSQFFVFCAMELAGAFLGGVTAWLYHIGHFNLKPKPPLSPHWTDAFLRPMERREETAATYTSFAGIPFPERLRFRKATSADEELQRNRAATSPRAPGSQDLDTSAVATNSRAETKKVQSLAQEITKPKRKYGMTDSDLMEGLHDAYETLSAEDWAYTANVIADQSSKLSVFATRPAIFNWWQNLLTETLGTMLLIWGAFTLEDVVELLPVEFRPLYLKAIFPFYLSLYVVACVGALGGPTGYAANPARDLGPRLAHWILPIPNKGSSEWHYAWIPIVGPFLGGLLAAALYEGTSRVMLTNK